MNHFASTLLSLSPVSLGMSGNPARAQHPAPRANAGIGVPLDPHGLLGTLGAGRGLTPRATQPMTPFPAGGVYPPPRYAPPAISPARVWTIVRALELT